MCFANILDDTSEMKLTMWPGVFEKYKTFLVENSYLIFIVIKNEKGNIVNSITTLN
jgi:DNA polymerase III alpha subunit